MNRLRFGLILPAFVAALALAIVGVVVIAQAAPLPSRQMTFVDERSGLVLTLQVEPGAADAGHFVLEVPSRGSYVGLAGGAMRALSPTSVIVNFDGAATFRPAPDAGGPPRRASVRLQAQVDPAHRTAEATLTEGTSRFHLVVPAIGRGGIEPTLAAFERATAADDGGALYDLMDLEVTTRYTRQAFAQLWAQQSASVGRVVALRRLSVGDVQTTDLGLSFITVTYDADLQLPGGVTRTARFDVFFLRQAGAWRFWSTSSPR